MHSYWRALSRAFIVGCFGPLAVWAQPAVEQQIRLLQEQNTRLQEQLQHQQELITDLQKRVQQLRPAESSTESSAAEPTPSKSSKGFSLGKINLSGEGGLAFFRTGSQGQFPNSEFRVDEAKLFVEAPIWNDIYFFGEVNITTREEGSDYLRISEIYLDWENPLRFEKYPRLLNFRIGRMDIPFGEEYSVRDAIDNPLITHSLSDLWGVDEGVELYGSLGKFSYVLAVQNGGHPSLNDYNADKAVAGRLAYDPTPCLHLSASGMRTGDLDVEDDFLSEMWFGNGLIRSLGSPATTSVFHAELAEADARLRWDGGHLKAAGGYIHYDDNDSSANNRRDIYYYYLEGLQHATKKIYGAARFSQIFAHKGFPIVGNAGDFEQYFFNELTRRLSRLSAGVGYELSRNLVVKSEFAWDFGETEDGESRVHQNFFGVEAAFKF